MVYLKHACNYQCPDLKEVIVNRFLKDAMGALNPMVLNLSEDEMLSLFEKKREVQAKKPMSAHLIRWVEKKYSIKGAGDEPLDKKIKLEEREEAKQTATRTDKKEEKRVKTEKEKSEADVPNEEENLDLITYLIPFVQFMRWDHADVEYFLKEMNNNIVMSQEKNIRL